jgi:beta-1,4-N-acetylglucosaminyltransferase
MIFVTVGTTDFNALIQRMDELVPTLADQVIMQIGRGTYWPRHAQAFRFAPTLDEYIAGAQLVVSHGGLGTIMEVVRRGIPLVGVSNPDRYDMHQDDLLETMERAGHLIWCRSLDDLEAAIDSARHRQFTPYVDPPCRIHEVIARFLHNVPRNRLLDSTA